MCDGYIGAGCIDAIQTAFSRFAFYKRRNAVCGKNDRSLGDLLQDTRSICTIECDHAQVAEFFNGMAVMYNLSNNIHGPGAGGMPCYLRDYFHTVHHPLTITTRGYFYNISRFLQY